MSKHKVISDSSFFICFLDDIQKPRYIIKILKCNSFKFIIGKLVGREISKSHNYPAIEEMFGHSIEGFEYYRYGELLRPFFSLQEIKEGEHEAIAISYILHFIGIDFTLIIDDAEPRKFVRMHFSDISPKMTGTIGFIKDCCCTYSIFSKEEGINILTLIKQSRFRIKGEMIDSIIGVIRRC